MPHSPDRDSRSHTNNVGTFVLEPGQSITIHAPDHSSPVSPQSSESTETRNYSDLRKIEKYVMGARKAFELYKRKFCEWIDATGQYELYDRVSANSRSDYESSIQQIYDLLASQNYDVAEVMKLLTAEALEDPLRRNAITKPKFNAIIDGTLEEIIKPFLEELSYTPPQSRN